MLFSLHLNRAGLCHSSTVEALVAMGYNRQEIEDSLSQVRYDDVFATYLLLGRKNTDVSFNTHTRTHFAHFRHSERGSTFASTPQHYFVSHTHTRQPAALNHQ